MCQITLFDIINYTSGQTLHFSFETCLINHLPDSEPQYLLIGYWHTVWGKTNSQLFNLLFHSDFIIYITICILRYIGFIIICELFFTDNPHSCLLNHWVDLENRSDSCRNHSEWFREIQTLLLLPWTHEGSRFHLLFVTQMYHFRRLVGLYNTSWTNFMTL